MTKGQHTINQGSAHHHPGVSTRPGVSAQQPVGQRLFLWIKIFVNNDLSAHSHDHSFTRFLWSCSCSPHRAETSRQTAFTVWNFPEQFGWALLSHPIPRFPAT